MPVEFLESRKCYEHFWWYFQKNEFECTQKKELLDYAAWRNGECTMSANSNVAVVSLMCDGKEAVKILRDRKYMKSPAYVLQKDKQRSKYEMQKYAENKDEAKKPVEIERNENDLFNVKMMQEVAEIERRKREKIGRAHV